MSAETVRTQAMAVRSQESHDAAERVMTGYLKASQIEARAALETALSAIENLDFRFWEACGHDPKVYRNATGAPSLAEAAAVIRAVLGQ